MTVVSFIKVSMIKMQLAKNDVKQLLFLNNKDLPYKYVYIYIYIYIYIYMCVCVYMYICIYIYIYKYTKI